MVIFFLTNQFLGHRFIGLLSINIELFHESARIRIECCSNGSNKWVTAIIA